MYNVEVILNKMFFFLLATTFVFSAFADRVKYESGSVKLSTQDVIRIEIGKDKYDDDDRSSKYDLYRRISSLERAVRQLQDRVFDLEVENGSLKDNQKFYTCFIKTPFDGTFTSTKRSMTEAKA